MSNNKRQLNWQVQHIFVRELAVLGTDEAIQARRMLASAGFNLESIGNKMGLLVSPQMRDSIKSAPFIVICERMQDVVGFSNFVSSKAE
jgi:hypothetical protein